MQPYILAEGAPSAELRFEGKQVLSFGISKKCVRFILPTDNPPPLTVCKQFVVCGKLVNSLLRACWSNLLGCDQPRGIFCGLGEQTLCSPQTACNIPSQLAALANALASKHVHYSHYGRGTKKGHGQKRGLRMGGRAAGLALLSTTSSAFTPAFPQKSATC